MKCACCHIDDDCRRCELVNGSWITLCGPCRRRHDEMIASIPISGPVGRRKEEDEILDWSREQMEAMAEVTGGDDIIGHGGLK